MLAGRRRSIRCEHHALNIALSVAGVCRGPAVVGGAGVIDDQGIVFGCTCSRRNYQLQLERVALALLSPLLAERQILSRAAICTCT